MGGNKELKTKGKKSHNQWDFEPDTSVSLVVDRMFPEDKDGRAQLYLAHTRKTDIVIDM